MLPTAASMLALGCLAPLVPLPRAAPRAIAPALLAAWSAGWAAWFLTGLLSAGHIG